MRSTKRLDRNRRKQLLLFLRPLPPCRQRKLQPLRYIYLRRWNVQFYFQSSSSGTSAQSDASAMPAVQVTSQPPAAIDLGLAYTLPLAGLTGQIQANSTIPGAAPNPFTVPIQLTQQQVSKLFFILVYLTDIEKCLYSINLLHFKYMFQNDVFQ